MYEYRLPTGELKKYEKERETIEKIFLCIVLLYDKIDHAENREFLKKFYFKAKKLFFKIGLRPYKTDYWRRKAIIKCLELLDTDKIDIGEEEAGVRKLRLEIRLYSGQERKRSAFLENLQSHVTDKSKVILERKNKNRFERLIYKHPDLKKTI